MAETKSDPNQAPDDQTNPAELIELKEILPIEQLFNLSWFQSKKEPLSTDYHGKESKTSSQSASISDLLKKYVPPLCYAPIGIMIFTLRLCILLQYVALVLAMPASSLKQKALRMMSLLLGVTYSVEGDAPINSEKQVYVANHVTNLDHFVIHVVTNSVSPLKLVTGIPALILRRIGLTDEKFTRKEDVSQAHEPILLFPEAESTNGQSGLLAFEPLPMLDDLEVVPIGLKASRSLLNVNTVQNGLISELLFLMFLPNTHFTLRFLPAQQWNARTVQECIGTSLKLLPTRYKASDKQEYIKKINFRPPSLTTMTRLVQKELHPTIISTETILTTLQRTNSVEKTVQELRKSMAEPSFHKSATERMMNFQERKRMMIETARRKYCEKHGLEF